MNTEKNQLIVIDERAEVQDFRKLPIILENQWKSSQLHKEERKM